MLELNWSSFLFSRQDWNIPKRNTNRCLIPFTTFRKQGNQNHWAPIWRKNGSLFLFVEGIRAQKWKRQESCEDNNKERAEAKTTETRSKWEKVGATKHDPLEKREGHKYYYFTFPEKKLKGGGSWKTTNLISLSSSSSSLLNPYLNVMFCLCVFWEVPNRSGAGACGELLRNGI